MTKDEEEKLNKQEQQNGGGTPKQLPQGMNDEDDISEEELEAVYQEALKSPVSRPVVLSKTDYPDMPEGYLDHDNRFWAMTPETFRNDYVQRREKTTLDAIKKQEDVIASKGENPFAQGLNEGYSKYFDDFVGLLRRPEDPEEQKRRERKAHAVAGLGALGNAMSALGNVMGVYHGAENQEMPKDIPNAGKAVTDERSYQQKLAQSYLEGSGKRLAMLRTQKLDGDAEKDKEIAQRAALITARANADKLDATDEIRLGQLYNQSVKNGVMAHQGNRRLDIAEHNAEIREIYNTMMMQYRNAGLSERIAHNKVLELLKALGIDVYADVNGTEPKGGSAESKAKVPRAQGSGESAQNSGSGSSGSTNGSTKPQKGRKLGLK